MGFQQSYGALPIGGGTLSNALFDHVTMLCGRICGGGADRGADYCGGDCDQSADDGAGGPCQR